jgi:hypothetical protein
MGAGDGIHNAEGIARDISLENGKQFIRLENFKVTNGPDLYVYLATDKSACDFVDIGIMRTTSNKNRPVAPADFALSESPRYVGRAVVALAMDPDRARWNKQSVSSGQLASEYGFKNPDGTKSDIWRYMKEFHELGLNVNPNDYR